MNHSNRHTRSTQFKCSLYRAGTIVRVLLYSKPSYSSERRTRTLNAREVLIVVVSHGKKDDPLGCHRYVECRRRPRKKTVCQTVDVGIVSSFKYIHCTWYNCTTTTSDDKSGPVVLLVPVVYCSMVYWIMIQNQDSTVPVQQHLHKSILPVW